MLESSRRQKPPIGTRVRRTPAGRILKANAQKAAGDTGRFQVAIHGLRTTKSASAPTDEQKKDAGVLIAGLKSVLSKEMSGKKITFPKKNEAGDDVEKIEKLSRIAFLLYLEQFFDTALKRTESKTAGDFATFLSALDVAVHLLETNEGYFSMAIEKITYDFNLIKTEMDNCATMCGITSLTLSDAVDQYVSSAREQYVTYLG